MNWDAHDREEAAEYYRRAVALGGEVSQEESNRRIAATLISSNGVPSYGMRRVGDIVAEVVQEASANLNVLQNPLGGLVSQIPERTLRSDGSQLPREVRRNDVPFDNPSIMTRLAVGGQACDFCGKSLRELGVTTLKTCSRCKSAYYCTVDCQKRAWKAGHKHHCREPNQIEVGDIMTLRGLETNPDMNGRLFRVLHADPATPGKWVVKTRLEGRVLSVSTKNLAHLRPAK